MASRGQYFTTKLSLHRPNNYVVSCRLKTCLSTVYVLLHILLAIETGDFVLQKTIDLHYTEAIEQLYILRYFWFHACKNTLKEYGAKCGSGSLTAQGLLFLLAHTAMPPVTMYYNTTIDYMQHTALITIKPKVIWQMAKSLWQVHATSHLYSPGGSIQDWRGLDAILQLHVLTGGSTPQNSPSSWARLPSNNASSDPTTVSAKWRLNPSSDFSKVHKCDRRQTNRQTTLRRNV